MLTVAVLQALLSPESVVRSQAETYYQSISPIQERIASLVNHLLELTSSTDGGRNDQNNNDALISLASVLLRRDILKLLDPALLNELVSPLLQCYNSTGSCSSGSAKQQIGHCLAEICSSLSIVDANAAVSALTKILSATNLQQDVSLTLMASLAERAPVAFTEVAVPSLPNFVAHCSLQSASTLVTVTQVIVQAAIATTISNVSVVKLAPNVDELRVEANSIASSLGETCLLPLLQPIANAGQSIEAQVECLQCLNQAAVTCPSFLAGKPNVFQAVVQLCLGLAQHHTATTLRPFSASVDLSLASLQVLTSILSVRQVQHGGILTQVMAQEIARHAVPACSRLMIQSMNKDTVEDWASQPATLVDDGVEEDDESDGANFAESLMESFIRHLTKPALAVAMPLVQELLQGSQDWRYVRAGLAILELGLEAAPTCLAPQIADIVQVTTSFAGDSNPRVRYQAIRLMGVLCETNSSVRELYGKTLLASMATALDSPFSKVSAMGSLGIVAYCRGSGAGELDVSQFVIPYLSDLMQALMQPLSVTQLDTGSVAIRVRAMDAVACLARAAEDFFQPFYDKLRPCLIASLQVPQAQIASAALQSLTIVGQAVGRQMFQSDAMAVLSWIVPVLSSESSSSIVTEDLLTACARVASVLQEDFTPYLGTVLSVLYDQANPLVDISILEVDESALKSADSTWEVTPDGMASMTVATPGLGFQRLSINTAAILKKAANNRVMYELVKATREIFGPNAQKSMDIFLPLLDFKYSADVRSTAAQTLSALFDAACYYGERIGDATIPKHYFPVLADSISRQIAKELPCEVEALYGYADSLSEIFYVVFGYVKSPFGMEILSALSIEQTLLIVKRCMEAMTSCLEIRNHITAFLNENSTGEDEGGLLKSLVDSVGYMLKFSRANFVPIFETHVVPVLGKYLSSTADVRASVASICLFDDCVEYCGPAAAAKYSPMLLQAVMAVFEDSSKYDKDLVQAAVYGTAQMARHAPSSILAPHVQSIVHQLLILSEGSKGDAGDSVYLHEIAVSALASLVLFGPFTNLKLVNQATVLDHFLNNLPIEEDEDEAKICHAGLCSLVENGTVNAVNHTAKITKIVGTILSDVQEGFDVASADTCERLIKILYEFQQQNPQSSMQAYADLDGETQSVLSAAMKDFSHRRSRIVTP